MENLAKKCCSFSCKLKEWALGKNPQGLGTFLVGIAALIALCQTNGILDKIMRVQEQAKKIEEGVIDNKLVLIEIKQAVNMLRQQLIANHAIQTVQNSPLKNADATKEQIQNTIDTIPNEPNCGVSIYLPQKNRGEVVEKLQQSQTPGQRQLILENALQYNSSQPNCNLN